MEGPLGRKSPGRVTAGRYLGSGPLCARQFLAVFHQLLLLILITAFGTCYQRGDRVGEAPGAVPGGWRRMLSVALCCPV